MKPFRKREEHPWDRTDPATECRLRFERGETPRSRDVLEELMRSWSVGNDIMKEYHYVSDEDREWVFQNTLNDLHLIETTGDYER